MHAIPLARDTHCYKCLSSSNLFSMMVFFIVVLTKLGSQKNLFCGVCTCILSRSIFVDQRISFKCLMTHSIPLYHTIVLICLNEGRKVRERGREVWRERKRSILICYWRVEGAGSKGTLLVTKNKVIFLPYSKMLRGRHYF